MIDESVLDDEILDVSSLDIYKILKNLNRLPNFIHSKPDATGAEKVATAQKNPAAVTTGRQTLPPIKVAVPLTMAERSGSTNKKIPGGSSSASAPMVASKIREALDLNQQSPNETETAARDESCPEELGDVVEAENKRVAQNYAQILLCTSAIKDVEAVLSPLATVDYKA